MKSLMLQVVLLIGTLPSSVFSFGHDQNLGSSYRRKLDEDFSNYQSTHKASSSRDYDFFVHKCTSQLLYPPVAFDDSMISQVDFTNFIVDICILTGACPPKYTTTFINLNEDLQLRFLWVECPPIVDTKGADEECLKDFTKPDEDGEFGLRLTDDNFEDMKQKINDLCSNIYPFVTDYYGGTAGIKSSMPSLSPSSSLPSSEPSPISIIDSVSSRSLDRDASIITTAAVGGLVLFLCLCVVCSRSRAEDQNKDDIMVNERQSESDNVEYDKLEGQPVNDDSTKRSAERLSENESKDDEEKTNSIRFIQFTADAPDGKSSVISDDFGKDSINTEDLVQKILDDDDANTDDLVKDILDTADTNPEVSDGTVDDDFDPEAPQSLDDRHENRDMEQLDAAIESGDWAAVAAIAGCISPGGSSASSHVSGKSLTEEQKTETINKLVAEGDWTAVGATATAFEGETKAESKAVDYDSPRPNKRRNLLDFITIPWSNRKLKKQTDVDSMSKERTARKDDASSRESSDSSVERNDSDEASNVQPAKPEGTLGKEDQRHCLKDSEGNVETESEANVNEDGLDLGMTQASTSVEERLQDIEESSNDETDSRTGWSSNSGKHSFMSQASSMDSEKIETLEKLIESDDWTGIVDERDTSSSDDEDQKVSSEPKNEIDADSSSSKSANGVENR